MKNLEKFLKELNPAKICFCAGARNATLLESLKEYELEYFIDERTAAFNALGTSKMTNRPVIICTTSGTAVAECLPAIIEAYYSGEKLVVISGDRPLRLQETFAPQTIKQDKILKEFCRFTYHGVESNLSMDNLNFPMHINLMLDHLSDDYIGETRKIKSDKFKNLVKQAKFPIAIFTESYENYDQELESLNKIGMPIYRETTYSGEFVKIKNEIRFEQELLRLLGKGDIDLIIKFGKTPFTKLWRLLDHKESKVKVVSFKNEKIGIPYGHIFCDELPDLDDLNITYKAHLNLEQVIFEFPESEIAIFYEMSKKIKTGDHVFVGNSMPIRYWQMLQRHDVRTYASRGANGIDGQLATALGMAENCDGVFHCILGDQTFLYDISSCLKPWPKNFRLHIINNGGGRIFERVKVPKEIILEHDDSLMPILEAFKKGNQSAEYLPDNKQTQKFWKHWEKL